MKLLTTLLAAIVLFVSFPADSFAVWFDSSWTYRIKITVDATQVPSTQTSFPVYLDLSDLPSDFHTNVKSDGCDIRMVESDESTETAFELVEYDDAADTGELHFMADSLDGTTDTDFYIYYGNAAASCYGTTATYGRNAVWSNYEFVFHMNDTSGNLVDSTGNQDATTLGNLPTSITGKIGDGQDFDGTGDYATRTSTAPRTSSYHFQSWLQLTSLTNTDTLITLADGFDGIVLDVQPPTASGDYRMRSFLAGTGAIYGPGDLDFSAWNKVELVRNGSSNYIYHNASVGTSDVYSRDITNTTTWIGNAEFATSRDLDGAMDEVRLIIGSVLSNDWITTEYNNQSSPSTFYTVGTQETDTGGARKRAIQIIGWYSSRTYV